MPVSLCEWRARIGTFVHWIRDYEIKERKERLLKERIRRRKVLCERLKEKMDDSEQNSEEDDKGESGEDGSSPMKRKQCPHKTTNIQSSGDSYIKDLLTSCDQCIHDLLTTSHCCSTDLLTPADGCIRKLLKPCDNGVKDVITPDYRTVKDLLRSGDYNVKDLITPEDCSVKDVITSGDCSIKDLITPEDCSIRDLIKPEDCSVKDLITPEDCSVKDFKTPEDCIIKDLIMPEDCSVKDFITPEDCSVKDLITPEDCSVKGLIMPEDCSVKDFITPEDCRVKDLITPEDCSVRDLITPEDCRVKDLITPEDCSVKDLITPEDCSIKDLITPEDGSVKDLITPEDCTLKDLITPDDCSVRDPIIPDDRSVIDLLVPGDYSVRYLITPGYHSVRDLIRSTPGDGRMNITSDDCSIKDLITPHDYSVRDLRTQEDCSVKDLITPDDSQVEGVFGQNDAEFNFSCMLSQIRPCSKERTKSNDKSVYKVLHTATDENIELVTPFVESNGESVTESCSRHHHALSDTSFKEHLSTNKSLTRNKLNNNVNAGINSYSKEKQSPSQCSVKEQLTSPCLETHKGLGPRIEQSDHLSVGLLELAVSKGEDHLQLSDFCIHEPRRSGDSLINDNHETRESSTSGKEQHPRPGTFTNEQPIRTNAVIEDQVSSESCKQFQTSTDTPVEEKSSVMVPYSSRDHGNNKRHGKAKPNGTCTSLCPGPSLKSKTGLIPEEMPPTAELLLLRSGDVELNPGPRQGPGWSLDLEKELWSLVTEVSPAFYYALCNALDFNQARSQAVLSKHLLDVHASLFEIICSWGVKQRDGTNYKEVLADKLRSVGLGALGRKLLQGGYRMTEPPASGGYRMTEPPASADLDKPQPVIDMTEEQVIKCGEDLKTFYLEEICKIKPDPLDFTSVLEFERIYTNLTLLNSKTPLDYTELLTTKVNGILPKRLMVEGEGGVGKTTFCSKIAWDWANGSPQFNQFSWVLVIPLRKVIKGQTVGDIVKNYLSDSNSVTPAQINDYIRSQPTKVLIVLDGLDEYDGDLLSPEYSDISQILRREKFKECIVLVTTRPWRADQIKCNEDLNRTYAFIAVKGFSAENVSSYIMKYFVDDEKAGKELIRFIEVNDIIRENMAPFPIYVAMLCILWKYSDSEKRETIRSLKTFSQLFNQMIIFLRDHYVSKVIKVLQKPHLDNKMKNTKKALLEIGSIAFSGLLKKKLAFTEEDFVSCKEAMETCCRIGVLSRENKNISRWDRSSQSIESITMSVFFPHKLFQEYIAALHLDFLFNTDRDKYNNSFEKVIGGDAQEFRYLLYFTAAQGQEIGLDIVEQLQENEARGGYGNPFSRRRVDDGRKRKGHNDFLVDVTFEAYNKDTAKSVGRRIFAEEKLLTIDENMPAHTVSGYLFIMEQHGMETLIFRGRSCGPTVSRDLADFLCSSSSLSRLEFHRTTLDQDFYRLLQDRASSALAELHVDNQFLDELHRFQVTIRDLFPSLKQLGLSALQTVTPGVVERLTHPNLSVLSIKSDSSRPTSYRDVKEGWLVPLIGEPASLGQLFSSSFPELTSLSFKGLVIGNKRCEAILRSLRNHKNMKSTSFISCFTDDELDFLARQISKENRIAITLDHDLEQTKLTCEIITADLMDALCHRTCIRELCIDNKDQGVMARSREWFSEVQGIEVDSKIQTFTVKYLKLRDDQSASCCLGKFICLLPCLTDLTIFHCSFHDKFYKEIADHASSSKIQTFTVKYLELRDDQSASCCLGKFICLLPCLTDLRIEECSFHDEFYEEIADRASSCKIQTFKVTLLELRDDHSASCGLRKFICLLPCLTDLRIELSSFHDEFYKEIADHASSSKIQTFTVKYLKLRDDQSASRCLGKFISLLPCLTDLRTEGCSFRDEFYEEIADRASSCKIQILVMSYRYGLDEVIIGQSASKQLARFLCSLPFLADLTLEGYDLHDDFYTEITSLAASSQNPYFRNKKHMGMLREWSDRKVRCQQQLINQCLRIMNPAYQHKPRSREQLGPNILQPRQSAQPSSVQYQNDHQRPIHSEHQQVHQLRNAHESGSFQQLGSCSSHPWQSPQSYEPYQNDLQRGIQSDHHQVHQFTNPHGSFQELGAFHPLQLPQSSSPYLTDHQTCIQPDHEQVQHLLSDLQESTQTLFQPITEHDQLTKTHLNEFDRYFRWYVSAQHNTCNSQASQYTAESSCQGTRQRSLHSGHIDTTQDTSVGHEQIDAIQTHNDDSLLVSSSEYTNSRTSLHRGGHSIGMKPMYEYDDDPDRPSTSGLSSADISTSPSPWEGERIPSHRKRIYSDSDEDYDDDGGGGDVDNDDGDGDDVNAATTAESLELRPRKRRAKTDRNPASP